MFIDYLTLVMINMVAGTALLAYYLWRGLDDQDQRPYAAGFFGVGLVALITGLHISFNWPLPGSYNVGYGDATTLFGTVFLITSLALWQGWNLVPVSIYAFFAGIDAIIVGVRISPCSSQRNLYCLRLVSFLQAWVAWPRLRSSSGSGTIERLAWPVFCFWWSPPRFGRSLSMAPSGII